MNKYETMFIINPELEDEGRAQLIDTFKDIITANAGEMIEVEEWGNRKLAYEIRKKQTGYYVLFHFNGEPGTLEELERNFRIKDDIFRYLILRDED